MDWFEDDAFWADVAPFLFNTARIQAAKLEVEKIVTLLNLSPHSSVLDLACGPGRLAIEFCRRGYHVVGVDRTLDYLERAKATARNEGLEAEFVHADMREFRRPGAFDVSVNVNSSFGYFRDRSEDLNVLRNVRESLLPEGILLLELMGKEILARVFRERDWQQSDDGSLLLEERTIADGWHEVLTRDTHTFTYHVEGALVRTLVGKDLTRVYQFSGEQLIVKSPDPNEHWRVAWEHY